MLVEDDNNLREIYEARLLAEGYEIVSAKDGEEALAIAVKEKPDLIISDVMMPKISGFDMLDILRSTAETKDTKVIMMTALSQIEDKERADKLGADRYLVKSQVTLEDVAKAAREVIDGQAAALTQENTLGSAAPATALPAEPTVPPASEPVVTASATSPTTPAADPVAAPAPAPPSNAPTPAPAASPVTIPITEPTETTPPATTNPAPTLAPEPTSPVPSPADDTTQPVNIDQQINTFMSQTPAVPQADIVAPAPKPAPAPDISMPTVKQPTNATGGGRVLEPIHDISTNAPDLTALLAQEEAREAAAAASPLPGQPINPTTPPQAA